MAEKKNKTNTKGKKQNKIKVDKKELIVTIVVLVAAIGLGFFLGKALFDALY